MRAEIFWITGLSAGRLAVLPRPRGGDWLEDEVGSLRACGVDILVSLLTRDEVEELCLIEQAGACASCGIEFISFPVPDREVPASAGDALSLVRRLAALVAGGRAVAVHCRQGVGRSGLVVACVLVALGERPAVALERVTRARGRPVPDTAGQREWLLWFAERHLQPTGGTTLLLSTRMLPAVEALSEAARRLGWSVEACDESPPERFGSRFVYYGRTDVVRAAAARGADPAAVLGVLECACRDAGALDPADSGWVVARAEEQKAEQKVRETS